MNILFYVGMCNQKLCWETAFLISARYEAYALTKARNLGLVGNAEDWTAEVVYPVCKTPDEDVEEEIEVPR